MHIFHAFFCCCFSRDMLNLQNFLLFWHDLYLVPQLAISIVVADYLSILWKRLLLLRRKVSLEDLIISLTICLVRWSCPWRFLFMMSWRAIYSIQSWFVYFFVFSRSAYLWVLFEMLDGSVINLNRLSLRANSLIIWFNYLFFIDCLSF